MNMGLFPLLGMSYRHVRPLYPREGPSVPVARGEGALQRSVRLLPRNARPRGRISRLGP